MAYLKGLPASSNRRMFPPMSGWETDRQLIPDAIMLLESCLDVCINDSAYDVS